MTTPMGAHLDGDRCHFRVWAPNASRVGVMGSFNGWRDDEYPLQLEDAGVWSITIQGIRAGDEYLYVIDNRGGDAFNPGQHGLRRLDPWARATRNSSGNAVIVDVPGELMASGLIDDPFRTPSGADWLIYQAHVGSFIGNGDGVDTGPTETGTFHQFEQKLSYIRSMGFNAVELLPVHESPGDGNEGYAPANLFAPESSYGSPLELRHLIRAAHDVGLAVIFDVVWNHLSDVDNRLWNFDGMTKEGGIFFEGGERSPWGPRPAFWKREVRDFIVAHARMCFEEYHIDGIRIDAADEIGRDVLADVVTSVRAEPRWQDKLLMVEWSGDHEDAWPALTEQLHFDRVWELEDPYIFREAMSLGNSGDASHRVDCLLRLIQLPQATSRVRYLLGSHDNVQDNQSGARSGYRYFVELAGGRDNPIARAKSRMGWALNVALPGTPMCFMGSESLQPGYWHPRRDANSGHNDHRFDWRLCEDEHGAKMHALVADANQIWWGKPAIRGGQVQVVHVDRYNGVVAFLRPGPDGPPTLVVVNASETSWPDGGYQVTASPLVGHWEVVLDTQAGRYGGEARDTTEQLMVSDGTIKMALWEWSLVVLQPALE